MEDIARRVNEIVAEQLGLAADEIPEDAAFSQDLGADTLDMVELVMAFEEEFGLEVDDEEAESLITVQDVIDFVSKRIQ
jgi:acyl carrier protein